MAVSDGGLFIVMAIAMSLFSYLKLSRLLGGMLMLISGIGILYVEPTYGWTGWIVFAVGFAMLLELLTKKPKKIKRR